MYSLWSLFTHELVMVAFDDKLDEDADIDEDEEQFLKQVRRLVVSLAGYYAKETTHEKVPGGNVKEEEEMAEENKMTENMAEQQFSAKQRHEGHKG